MTTLRLNPKALEMWKHQNQAEYTGMYVEGNLLDNFVLATKRGFAVVYEKFVNTWTSEYLIKFAPYGTKDADKIITEFMEFEDKAWTKEEM